LDDAQTTGDYGQGPEPAGGFDVSHIIAFAQYTPVNTKSRKVFLRHAGDPEETRIDLVS
jgi:hypothetical protein